MSFNKEKINWNFEETLLTVTRGQMKYEKEHLLNKLKKRDKKKYNELILQNVCSRLIRFLKL